MKPAWSRRELGRLGVAGLAMLVLAPSAAAAPLAPVEPEMYIVQLAADPLGSYGGDRSLPATSPRVTGEEGW